MKFLLLAIASAVSLSSCSKKPAEYYRDGMKSIAAGNCSEAQATFAKGIRGGANDSLYAGFVVANLVTGKYPQVNSAYNQLSDSIHTQLVQLYGKRAMQALGITSKIIPYNVNGGNRLPADFAETIMLQAAAYPGGYAEMVQQIDRQIGK